LCHIGAGVPVAVQVKLSVHKTPNAPTQRVTRRRGKKRPWRRTLALALGNVQLGAIPSLDSIMWQSPAPVNGLLFHVGESITRTRGLNGERQG
jgi:hypothetical protein